MPISLYLLATLAFQGPFGSITCKDEESVRYFLDARGPTGIEMQLQPTSGKPQARVWRGEEEVDGKKLNFSMMAAMPNALEENKKTIRDEIKRRENEFEREGGRTMTIERGTFKIRLTARKGYDGSIVLHESSTAPVLYYRTIIAQDAMAERAKSMLTNLTLSDGQGTTHQMYDRGFPTGWTYEFAGTRVKVPIPAQWEYLKGTKEEDGFVGDVRYTAVQSTKESSWGMTERQQRAEDSILDLAKKPLPRSTDFSPNARITKADLVEWNGVKMLRQQGLFGNGEFERDWMSLTVRDQHWRLHTVFLKKDKTASWPSVPFPITAVGTPVVESAWKKPNGIYARTVDLGAGAKFTYSVWGVADPEEVGGVYTLNNETNEATTLKVKDAGKKGFEEWVLASGAFVPKKLEELKLRVVDVQWFREGASWWMRARYMENSTNSTDTIRLVELVGTEQGGQKFVLTLAGTDTERYREKCQEAVMSCKGANGEPLFKVYPEGQPGSEYALPYHKFRAPVTGISPIPAVSFGDGHILLGGYIMPNDTRVFHSIQLNSWGGVPHLQRVFEGVFRGQKQGKYSRVKFKNSAGVDVNADRREFKTSDGRAAFVTTFTFDSGAYTHVLQPKGLPEEAWRKHLGLK